jgi:hypothetical protein
MASDRQPETPAVATCCCRTMDEDGCCGEAIHTKYTRDIRTVVLLYFFLRASDRTRRQRPASAWHPGLNAF